MAFLKQIIRIHCFISVISLFVGGFSAAVFAESDACDDAKDEYKVREIKSAFIIKLTSYVEWPPQAFSETPDAFMISILGDDPFQDVIDYFQGKIIKGKKLQIRRITSPDEISISHILFISPSESYRLNDIVNAVRNTHTLTVGDAEGFARRGVIVNFYIDNCYVRFEINPTAVRQAKLKVSSRLYRLARIIEDGE